METQAQSMNRAQRDKWDMLGATPVWERGTVRLPQFRKSFDASTEVMVRNADTGVLEPFKLKSGRTLMASEVMPERADLALTESGEVLGQRDFEANYEVYLEAFVMPKGFDRSAEPIPNVLRFINAKPDSWGESRGTVEIDFDPHAGGEFSPQVMFDGTNEIPREEYERDLAAKSAKEDRMEALLLALGEKVLAQESEEAFEAAPAEKPKEAAPCGKMVTKGYVAVHQRNCQQDECNPGDDAA